MELNSLSDVLSAELADLYSAENQLVDALPKMAAAAHSDDLRQALEAHLDETRGHVQRLEEAFSDLDLPLPASGCEGMHGLIAEGEQIIASHGEAAALDAALIGAAQRVEHYEMAAYGTAKTLAGELGLSMTESLLDLTLQEEGKANKLLTKLATGGMIGSGINHEAAARD